MSSLNRITDTVRESLDVLAEGWQDLWNRARHAITRFTPISDDDKSGANRWSLLSAELVESGDGVTVSLEAPGLSKENFEIFVNGDVLVVRGRKETSSERKDGHYHITERAYGRFERRFALPIEVDEEGTSASYRHGVLTINLPRSKRSQPRIISIT